MVSRPNTRHLVIGGLIGIVVGLVGFIAIPNLTGDATDEVGLERFDEADAIETGADRAPPRDPVVHNGRLAAPPWESASDLRIVFVFDISTTNESGDGRIQIDARFLIQGRLAGDEKVRLDTQNSAGRHRIESDTVRFDPERPLEAGVELDVDRFPNGGEDWTLTILPVSLRQETIALDTDHDGVPQPIQPFQGFPSYFASTLLALVGVNAAHLWKRMRPPGDEKGG